MTRRLDELNLGLEPGRDRTDGKFAQLDGKFAQEVQELRRQSGAQPSPEALRQTAFRALDRLFGDASSLDGHTVSAKEKSNFRASYDYSSQDHHSAHTTKDYFRRAEARAIMPMIKPGQFDPLDIGDASPVQSVNGSFFSRRDLERMSSDESANLATARDSRLRPGLRNNVDKVVALISRNEGGVTSINWNDAGSGISVGIQQCNQKAGSLPELLRRMHEDNPEKFNRIFGRYSSALLNENFVRHANFSPRNELGRSMQMAVREPEFQRTQVKMVREHVVRSAETARQLGIKSTMGVALVADLTNQFGEAGAIKYLRQANYRRGEEAKISAIARASEGGHYLRRQRFNAIASSGIVSSRDNFMV